MTEPITPRPLTQAIPPDLRKQVEDIQTTYPSTTGSSVDLNEEKKRWLIVGICLHAIISPLLRKYVDPILSNLYKSLVSCDAINTQGYNRYLKKFPATNSYFLTYESINNNRNVPKTKMYNKWVNDYQKYDYKVTNHVDLSKLFLQPSMALYTKFDESCDSSALLGLVINISTFPQAVQNDATKIRSDIRNRWAHCDFTEWTPATYTDSFDLMGNLVKNLGLSNKEENIILGDLNTWGTNGQHFMSGTALGLEIVEEIRQHTRVLSEYVQKASTEADNQFLRVQNELNDLENGLQERIKKVENITRKHELELKSLTAELNKQDEDHIPKNIRVQHREEIKEWEQDQTTFFETRATRHILESLHSNNCIVVTGSSGCGKSSNIHHVALHLRDRFGFEIIPVLTGPTDIINYYDKNNKQVFVVDDICGKETINTQTLQIWRDFSEKMEKIFVVSKKENANTKDDTVLNVSSPVLLITCRLHIYKEPQFQRVTLLTKGECNLLSQEFCLQPGERNGMLHKYLPDDLIAELTKKHVCEKVNFFPLLCKLSKDKTLEEVNKLFSSPLNSIKKTIHTIITENKEQYCALALCILFDEGFSTDWLEIDSAPEEKKDKLEHIVNEFDINLSKERHRHLLKSGFLTLHGTYLKLRDTEYRVIHDKIYSMAAVICGQHLTECFIKYAPSVLIRDHFIFDDLPDVHENDISIVLSKQQEEEYFKRLLFDLNKFDITSTFHNSQLIYQSFINKLICFFRRRDDAKALLNALDTFGCEIKNNVDKRNIRFDQTFHKMFYFTTPLMESASNGYTDIVEFLIINAKCKVNNTEKKGMSVLYAASERGHSDVVKLLLENNADSSYRNINKESSLCVACKRGHINTVELLLQYNADVSQCDNNGASPLYLACKEGHSDVAELLLHNNADVSQCNLMKWSPLLVACERGHTHVVTLLLKRNADVSQCNQDKESPLYVACKGGHTDVAELLLKNKADVSQCNKSGVSPLYLACKLGNKAIVELLLQNNANVFQCNRIGWSPLLVACGSGHTHIVQLLLQNNADVFQYDSGGWSPLHESCGGGHVLTVNLLLQNNADVYQCTTSGESSLYVACRGHNIRIARLLLKKKADVSQCNQYGESPLHVACKDGYTKIVKLLLNYNANVSQCNYDNESPLYMACKAGYTDIVELLLQNNADVNQCDILGESALCVARRYGYINIVELLLQRRKVKEL